MAAAARADAEAWQRKYQAQLEANKKLTSENATLTRRVESLTRDLEVSQAETRTTASMRDKALELARALKDDARAQTAEAVSARKSAADSASRTMEVVTGVEARLTQVVAEAEATRMENTVLRSAIVKLEEQVAARIALTETLNKAREAEAALAAARVDGAEAALRETKLLAQREIEATIAKAKEALEASATREAAARAESAATRKAVDEMKALLVRATATLEQHNKDAKAMAANEVALRKTLAERDALVALAAKRLAEREEQLQVAERRATAMERLCRALSTRPAELPDGPESPAATAAAAPAPVPVPVPAPALPAAASEEEHVAPAAEPPDATTAAAASSGAADAGTIVAGGEGVGDGGSEVVA